MKHYKPSGGKAKKRLLALVLALAVVCSSLMSVYANGVATMDMGFGVDDGFGVDAEFGVDAQMDDDFFVDTQDEDEDEDLDLAPGVTVSVDKDGNIHYTWDKDTYIDWTGDDAIASPYPDGEQMDPGFAIPTITYRFWLTEKDSAELDAFNAEVASGVKLYGMTEAEYIDLYGPNDGMFSAVHIADGGSLWDNSFKNPTAADAPNAGKPNFAGWYTVDEYGYQRKFTFDTSCEQTYVEAGVVHAAKSATVDVFAKWSANATDTASQPITNPNFDDTLDDHTYDKWYAALVSSSDSAFQGLLEKYTNDEGFCEYLDNLPDDEIQYLSEKIEQTAMTIPGSESIGVGEEITLTSTKTSSNSYSWRVTDSSVVSIQSKNGNTAVIKGLKAGTTTVTYGSDRNVDTFTITVTAKATFKITHEMENVDVAWVDFSDETSNLNFTSVSNGETVTRSGANGSGILIFFVKPKDNYLLTEFREKGGNNVDLYSLDVKASDSRINYFSTNKNNTALINAAQSMLDVAKSKGYLGYYAFSYGTKDGSATYTYKAVKPELKVSAVADKSSVKPGDKVEFTVTITPQTVLESATESTEAKTATVKSLTVESLTINGTVYENVVLTKNETNGTYTTTVEYTAKDEDWLTGDITLKVSATSVYSYKINVKDRNDKHSEIDTEATVNNSGTTVVSLASGYGIVYNVTYEPGDITPPDSINYAPTDNNRYYVTNMGGDLVTVSTYGKGETTTPPNKVVDNANHGEWTFNGWYRDAQLTDKVTTDTIEMVEGGITLYGKWTFVETTTTVTITKKVTGFVGDTGKQFGFNVTVTDNNQTVEGVTAEKTDKDGTKTVANLSSFTLADGEYVTLSNVPINATVTVTETDADGYDVSAKIEKGLFRTTSLTKVDGANSFTHVVAADADDNSIIVTNHKSITPDAGIDLGSATPYLFLLCVGAVGVATLKRKRER